jgi:type IV secretion system protein VirB2
MTPRRFANALILGALAVSCSYALASSGGEGLPWDSPLETLLKSLQGPVAKGISVISIVIAGGTLVFGGELNDLARRVIMLVLVIAVLSGSAGFMSGLFGSGAIL